MIVTFANLPKNLAELKALPQAGLSTPFDAVALAIAACASYGDDPDAACEMIGYLKGPGGPVSPFERQFLRDRLSDGRSYIARSFFRGAVPENDYAPDIPYSVEVAEGPYTYSSPGYATLLVSSGGADSPRPVTVRSKPSTGQWFLSDGMGFLAGIRLPVSLDSWA